MTPNIIQALNAVMRDVTCVPKDERNSAQNFNFRGIDGVVNAVGPAMRRHGVVFFPQVLENETTTVEVGKNKSLMAKVNLKVAYEFCGPAGDSKTAIVVAEAMDSGDKATSKAMSVAERTALLQVLCIPTDEPDPDSYSYEMSGPPEESDPKAAALWGTFMEHVSSMDPEAKAALNEFWAEFSGGRPKPTKATATPKELNALIAKAVELSFGAEADDAAA